MEHDAFTELLWAVLHRTEELSCRTEIGSLPDSDVEHLLGDVKRAFTAVFFKWLHYICSTRRIEAIPLQKDYPYLFSLAVRTSPFDPDSQPEVRL